MGRAQVTEAKELSASKVMATVFLNTTDDIMLDFLPKKGTVTGEYYAKLHDQLKTVIHEN